MVPKHSSNATSLCRQQPPSPRAPPGRGQGDGDRETRHWAHPGEFVGSVPTGAGVICPVSTVQILIHSPGAALEKGSLAGTRIQHGVCRQHYPVACTTAPGGQGSPNPSPIPLSRQSAGMHQSCAKSLLPIPVTPGRSRDFAQRDGMI